MSDPVTGAVHTAGPRPYHEWTEEVGDVLWWLWPIVDAPYCGTPLDLGYTVEIDLGIASSQRTFEPVEAKQSIQIGGWPFDESDDNDGYHRLFWTELPSFDALDVAIRDYIRGGPDFDAPLHAVSAAEGDLLGRCLEALRQIEMYAPDVGVDQFHSGLSDARRILSQAQAREVK